MIFESLVVFSVLYVVASLSAETPKPSKPNRNDDDHIRCSEDSDRDLDCPYGHSLGRNRKIQEYYRISDDDY